MQNASMKATIPRDAAPKHSLGSQPWSATDLRLLTLLAPVFVIVTSLAVFQVAKSVANERAAQLIGFAFYWSVCGLTIPLIILRRSGYSALFAVQSIKWNLALAAGAGALFIPAAFGFLFAFPYLFPAESNLLIPGLLLYALINGTFEEVFWRGLFINQFRDNRWMGVVYPGVMFGLWQLVPWALFGSWLQPPVATLLAISIPVGLLFNWVAWRTRSIRLTTMAHVLANFSGIGALLIFATPG